MQIAVLTFDGFNELDSFIAAAILNRLHGQGWAAHITAPTARVTSMNGVTIDRQKPLEYAEEADAVIVGSGVRTREIAADPAMLDRIRLDPARQLVGAQCSGTLLLAKLGLIGDLPACTDLTTKPWVIEAGVEVLDAPFVAHGNVAPRAAVSPRNISLRGSSRALRTKPQRRRRSTMSRRSARRRFMSSARWRLSGLFCGMVSSRPPDLQIAWPRGYGRRP